MTFIHELPDWPRFTWDNDLLAAPLAAVRHAQGLHLGRMQTLGFELRSEAGLETLTREVVQSWAIEGESIDAGEVRSSIASRLGLDAGGLPSPSREVDGVVEMMLDATRNSDAQLTAERLRAWHAALFPTGRSGLARITVGAWRPASAGPMQVVSGSPGHELVHFEAPTAVRLEEEMSSFLAWFDGGEALDPVLKAGLAHLWFVTIHPFEDGNRRIARAIGELALSRADGTPERFYSLSTQIEVERKSYYLELEGAQRGDLDVTAWLLWFLACLGRAIEGSEASLARVLRKARVWERANRGSVNERQRRALNRLLGDFEGHLTSSKYAKLAGCSTDTALRDIQQLVDLGVLARNPGAGRSTSYRVSD